MLEDDPEVYRASQAKSKLAVLQHRGGIQTNFPTALSASKTKENPSMCTQVTSRMGAAIPRDHLAGNTREAQLECSEHQVKASDLPVYRGQMLLCSGEERQARDRYLR